MTTRSPKTSPQVLHQQEKKRSAQSESPKAKVLTQTPERVNQEHRSSQGRCLPGGLDTVVLTKRLHEVPRLVHEWDRCRAPRWNPALKIREYGWLHWDAGGHGWWLDYLPERNVLEVTLQVPRIMGQSSINYPLRPFVLSRLARTEREILSELGLARSMPNLNWTTFGVRSADFTIDLPIARKTELLRALKTYQRFGKQRTWGSETIQWRTGGRVVQFYDKLRQLESTLGKKELSKTSSLYSELADIVRFEVRLNATELRHYFGLKPGWLPTLALVARSEVTHEILGRELSSGFKIDRIGISSLGDAPAELAVQIAARAAELSLNLPYSQVCQIVVTTALARKATKVELAKQFGVSVQQLSKLLRLARGLGLVPGADGVESTNVLHEYLTAFFTSAYPGPLPDVQLTDQERMENSVDASWLEEPDLSRPAYGIDVDDGDNIDLEYLDLLDLA